MYTISKEFTFSASHILAGLPKTHPCTRLHGHNYKVVATFQSYELNAIGFIIDYRDLYPIKDFIDQTLDHRHLNEIVDFNPTAENLARYLFEQFKPSFPQLVSIRVCETDKTSAEYMP